MALVKDIQEVLQSAAVLLDFVGVFCSGKFMQGEGSSYLDNAISARRAALSLLPPASPLRLSPSNNLAVHLATRCSLQGASADLDEAIEIHQSVLAHCEPDYPDRSVSLNNLAYCLFTRFSQLGILDDLEGAIEMNRSALQLRPPDHPDRVGSLCNLAGCLYIRYEKTGANTDLEETAALLRHALEFCPAGHPSRSTLLSNLAAHLFTLYNRTGGINYLEETISMHRSALELLANGHPDRASSLYNIAVGLAARYERLAEIPDLEGAIKMQRAALDLRPQGHLYRSTSLNGLAICLHQRFRQTGTMEDLQEAIELQRGVLGLCPPGHELRSSSMTNLGTSLSTQYNKLGAMADLEEAIVMHRGALELHPPGNPSRFMPLHNVALCLHNRYDRLGSMDDLEEAIANFTESLELLQPDHPRRPMILDNFGFALFARYKEQGMMDDLERAMSAHKEVLEVTPPGHLSRPLSTNNLAMCLFARYEVLGNESDFEQAMKMHGDILTLRPPGHPDRDVSLNNVACSLILRYNQHGKLTDLESAISMFGEELEISAHTHPRRPRSLDNLGCCLRIRYLQLGVESDLEAALALHREALALRSLGDPGRLFSLGGIAKCLVDRHRRTGVMSDLEEAITIHKNLQVRSEGHPMRWATLNNFAHAVGIRFDKLGDLGDLDDSLLMYREALQLQSQRQAIHVELLNAIADRLLLRYKRLSVAEDLAEATMIYRDTLAHCALDHPERPRTIVGFGACLLRAVRSDRPGATDDRLKEAFDTYAQLSSVRYPTCSADLQSAKAWVDVAEDHGHHSTVLAYRTSLSFLVQLLATLAPLPQNLTTLKGYTSSLAVDAFSACLRHKRLADAIELIEQGRSVFWTQRLRLRHPVDDVESASDMGRELAEKFTQSSLLLRSALDTPFQLGSPYTSLHDQTWRLSIQLQDVVEKIRALPGHSHFLLPLAFPELRKAAVGGPVIIVNASKYSCDALIVLFEGDPIHVPLQTTETRVALLSSSLYALISRMSCADEEEEKSLQNALVVILRELWDDVVLPIVTVLMTLIPRRSRIWWCPTASFSVLPLHAAGEYRKGKLNLADLYISSYTPTLMALIRARQKGPDPPERPMFLTVGQAEAARPNLPRLASVHSELAYVSNRIAPLATWKTLEGPDASVAKVIEALSETQYVHVACHGVPDRSFPFKYGFPLHDADLTVEDIMRCDLARAQFAYLSACRTTVGDEESPDEVIHLAGAVHVAGFRSVIATMWSVEDKVAPKVADLFYRDMVDECGRLDHTRAAYALNRTMRRVKGVRLDQRIVLVHIGA